MTYLFKRWLAWRITCLHVRFFPRRAAKNIWSSLKHRSDVFNYRGRMVVVSAETITPIAIDHLCNKLQDFGVPVASIATFREELSAQFHAYQTTKAVLNSLSDGK